MDNQNRPNNVNTPAPQQYAQPQYTRAPQQYAQPPVGYAPPQQYAPAPQQYAVPYQPYVPAHKPVFRKKQYTPLSKSDHSFMFLFLLCTVIFTDFALFNFFHLGFTLAYCLIFGVTTFYLWDKEEKPGVFSIICGLLSLAGAFTSSLHSNVLINTIMVFLVAGLFIIYCLGISGTFTRKQGNFKMLLDLASDSLIHPFENLGDVLGSIKAGAKKGKRNLSVFAGILVALPVLTVIIPLLVSGDAAFEGLVKTVAKNIGVYLVELFIALLVFPLVYSYMYGKKHKLNVKERAASTSKGGFISSVACISFLSAISLVYVVYLFSQLAYFFSAFSGLLPEDYEHTASAFARRGFFEMFAVVAINIVLITVVSAVSKRNPDGRVSMGIKVLSLFISMFSVLMLATAAQKMRLNIATYGLSRNRVLVSVFMMMMVVVIAFFIIHIFAPKVSYMQPIIVICSVLFIALAFSNVDTVCTTYNVKAYQSGKLETVDIQNISDVGDGGIPAMVALTNDKDKKTAAKAEMYLAVYVSESNRFTSKDGNLKVKGTDFRRYVKVRDDAEKAVIRYFKELPKDDKEYFLEAVDSGVSYYDDYSDSFYGDGREYSYNAPGGRYEPESEEWDSDYEFDEFGDDEYDLDGEFQD